MKKTKKAKSKDAELRERQFQTCIWFAEMLTPTEVIEKIQEVYGITLRKQTLWEFCRTKKWGKVIRYLRDRFLNDLARIPIANKSVRLKYLHNIYHLANKESLKSINRYGKVYEKKLGAAIQSIQAAREELEGKNNIKIDASKHTHLTIEMKEESLANLRRAKTENLI